MLKTTFTKVASTFSTNILLKGSALVFIASFGGNVLNYFYQLLMGRMLSPEDYAALFSLLSITYFSGVIGGVIQTSVTKIVSEIKAFGEEEYLKELLFKICRPLVLVSLTILVTLWGMRGKIADFLHISPQINLTPFILHLALSFFVAIPLSFLRGLLKFKRYSFMGLFQATLKLLLSVLLVGGIGLGLQGSLWAQPITTLTAITVGLVILLKTLKPKDVETQSSHIRPTTPGNVAGFASLLNNEVVSKYLSRIWSFSLPVLLTGLGLASFHNADVILVKHFFPALEAGRYSSAVLMGRIIFFATAPIPLVLFPISSISHTSGNNPRKPFQLSLALVILAALGGLAAYTLFPTPIVSLLFGQKYLGAVPLMPWFALFMGIYSLVNLFVFYFLSTHQTRVFIPLIIGALTQVGIITAYHPSLKQVVKISSLCALGVLLALIMWYKKTSPQKTLQQA